MVNYHLHEINHHQKLTLNYIPVMFSAIKIPISFACKQLK